MTTTDLRKRTGDLVKALQNQEVITLIHRSKVIGSFLPEIADSPTPIDPKRFAATLKEFEPKKRMSYKRLMQNYDHYMKYRHGSRIS